MDAAEKGVRERKERREGEEEPMHTNVVLRKMKVPPTGLLLAALVPVPPHAGCHALWLDLDDGGIPHEVRQSPAHVCSWHSQ